MFITLEGVDGSGKTTQIEHIKKYMRLWNIDHIISREPGGTSIGKQIREILLNIKNVGIDPNTELLLCLADRVQHIKEIIEPSINKGAVIICDRYVDSTIVYQGFARGLNISNILYLHDKLCKDLMPDITILMDINPRISLLRSKKRLGYMNDKSKFRFEQENINFHIKIRNGYLILAKYQPKRFHIIDASLKEMEIRENIRKILKKQLLHT